MSEIRLIAIPDFPLVQPGDELGPMILNAVQAANLQLENGDVLVLAQKIISKSENCYRKLADVDVSDEAREWAQKVEKEPELVQLILDEANEVVRHRKGVMIVEHRLGYVHANAGIDRSNIPDDDQVLLLPPDANLSAQNLRSFFLNNNKLDIKVIVNDSAGRAWRNGITGFAIGSAGFKALVDKVGSQDLFGRPLMVTSCAVADELASAASLLMGQADEGCPLVLVRGAALEELEGAEKQQGSEVLIRNKDEDLFR